MKSILLFLFLRVCSYSINMTQISKNSRTSLPTMTSYNKFFFVKDVEYSSSYIYICFEDSNFGLIYNNIQYCRTDINIYSFPDKAVNECSFSTIPYYYIQSLFNTTKYYYYKIPSPKSPYFSVVFYQGSSSSGSLYVTSNSNDLAPNLQMINIYRNSKTSLPTATADNKYFYLINSEYYSCSNYIYICLEDKDFGFINNNIQYCYTNTNPGSNPNSAVSACSFSVIYYYSYQSSSGTYKYYYKIPTTNYYTYSIIYYQGSYSFGYFDVTSDYFNLNQIIKMTQVYKNSKTSLPTTSENKFFYLTNNEYYPYSNYIYIYFEDKDFGLINSKINYCQTNDNPSSSPYSAVSSCSFNSISFYSYQSSSNLTKYYYKIPTTNDFIYSIFFYEGSYSSGSIYITSNSNDLSQIIKMTQVYRNSKTYLPRATSEKKYFYLTNSEYYSYSTYIYICLEDKDFGLRYYNIKYCHTNINPGSNPDITINGCLFRYLPYYSMKSSSGTYKYYYQISNISYYTYTIVYYEGDDSSGNPYVTSDYNSLLSEDNSDDNTKVLLSTGAIIGITIGSNIFIVIIIIIICYYCPCFKKTKTDFMPETFSQPLQILPKNSEDN